MVSRVCPECGAKKIVYNGEGLVCEKCGLVISEGIYSGQKMLV